MNPSLANESVARLNIGAVIIFVFDNENRNYSDMSVLVNNLTDCLGRSACMSYALAVTFQKA